MKSRKRKKSPARGTIVKPISAADALRRLRAIGRILVARGVALRDVDLGDELVFLGGQAIDQAEAALADLAPPG